MLANIIPIGHVSDVNVARSNLLFSMLQDEYTINVAKIISDEIQRIVGWERIRGAEVRNLGISRVDNCFVCT